MAKQSELTLYKDLCNAFFRFIQKHPPKGFNVPALQIYSQCGRLNEISKMLDDWSPPSETNESSHT